MRMRMKMKMREVESVFVKGCERACPAVRPTHYLHIYIYARVHMHACIYHKPGVDSFNPRWRGFSIKSFSKMNQLRNLLKKQREKCCLAGVCAQRANHPWLVAPRPASVHRGYIQGRIRRLRAEIRESPSTTTQSRDIFLWARIARSGDRDARAREGAGARRSPGVHKTAP